MGLATQLQGRESAHRDYMGTTVFKEHMPVLPAKSVSHSRNYQVTGQGGLKITLNLCLHLQTASSEGGSHKVSGSEGNLHNGILIRLLFSQMNDQGCQISSCITFSSHCLQHIAQNKAGEKCVVRVVLSCVGCLQVATDMCTQRTVQAEQSKGQQNIYQKPNLQFAMSQDQRQLVALPSIVQISFIQPGLYHPQSSCDSAKCSFAYMQQV